MSTMNKFKAHWPIILLLIGYLALSVITALNKPFWFDELSTVYIANAKSVAQVYDLLGVEDPHPPLTFIMVFVSQKLFGLGELSSRLPSIIFTAIFLYSTYKICEKYWGRETAAVASLLVLFSAAIPYAVEARPYAVSLGFVALTYHVWIDIRNGHRPKWKYFLLFVFSACTVLTHFYAVLALIPLFVYDLVRIIRGDRTAIHGFIASVLGAMVLFTQISLILEISALKGTHWSRPDAKALMEAFISIGWPMLALLIISITRAKLVITRVKNLLTDKPAFSVYVLLSVMVLYTFVISWFTGAFHLRYVLPSLLGVSISTALLFSLLAKGQKVLALILIMAIGVVKQYKSIEHNNVSLRNYMDERVEEVYNLDDKPVLMTDPLEFLAIWHYSDSAKKQELYFVVDVEKGFDFKGSAAFISLYGMSKFVPGLKVMDYRMFDDLHKSFYIQESQNSNLLWFKDLLKSKRLKKTSSAGKAYIIAEDL